MRLVHRPHSQMGARGGALGGIFTWCKVSRLGTSQWVRPATWIPPCPAGPCLTARRSGGPGARRSLGTPGEFGSRILRVAGVLGQDE